MNRIIIFSFACIFILLMGCTHVAVEDDLPPSLVGGQKSSIAVLPAQSSVSIPSSSMNTIDTNTFTQNDTQDDVPLFDSTQGDTSFGFSPETFHKPDDNTLKEMLTPLQYDVTQKGGTEKAFKNEYWDNKKEGIYVDRVSGEPLFSSLNKYESGTGWPSFWQPLEPENIIEKEDRRLFGVVRTEARSKHADSHLGHIFSDGPSPTGLRYCINSAALKFIPKEKLTEEGYGKYDALFE